ncbi:MAG: DUF4439 domain-containing protein [Candidatus Nanopelagicales bacterium]
MPDSPLLAALQEALAGEHAAVWAAGRAAGQLTGARQEAALDDLETARIARDRLREQIVRAGGEPVSAAPAYEEPKPVSSASRARALMAQISLGLVPLYARLAGTAPAGSRAWPTTQATTRAARAVFWGAPTAAFPGAPGVTRVARGQPGTLAS